VLCKQQHAQKRLVAKGERLPTHETMQQHRY